MNLVKPAPSWIPVNCAFAFDFCRKRYWNGYIDESGSEVKGSCATDGGAYGSLSSITPYTPQRNGILLAGLASQNRITNLGLFVERGAVNNCLWSRDLTNAAWASSSATVAKNQIGNDTASIITNTQSCSSITATANNATVLQAISLTSRVVIFSCYIKRLSGTGTISITSDGITYTDVTAQINSSGYIWVQNPQQTLSSVNCGIQLGTSGDSIAVDFCQLETSYTGQYANLATADKASTPIVTTSAANTRANQVAYWQNQLSSPIGGSGNNGQRIVNDIFSYGGPWAMIMSFNGDFVDDQANGGVRGPIFIASDGTFPTSITGGGGTVGFGNNFTNKTSNVCNVGRLSWNIAAVSCNMLGTTVCLNGGAPSAVNTGSTNIPNLNAGMSHFNIGNNGAGVNGAGHNGPPLNGSIGSVYFFKRELTNGELVDLTNLTGQCATFL